MAVERKFRKKNIHSNSDRPIVNFIPIKAALADQKKVVRGGLFLVFPFLVFEKSIVVAAMAAWAEAVQGQG